VIFQVFQFGVRHFALGVGADRFENILNGDVVAGVFAGRDRPAVEDQARDVRSH
jgi:hypothetical protein